MSHCRDSIKKLLPKTYERKRVAHEIFATMAFFRALIPKMEKYVYNDGATKNLMSLSGTVPVIYNEKTYHIPICLWLEESYPQTAPMCYVKPTRDMVIIRGQYVSSGGEVTLPYLEDWKAGECDLLSLVQVMIGIFGECPPLAMRPIPESEQTSCSMQFRKQAEIHETDDGSSYMSLLNEDGQLFQQENETNC
ncbi:tumor susceptibility gene 101 protein [Mugil cephalus]|uniref:tumor susceptibility gene 101 protein n=1 Tax=Mugil cephalus TaxID=48193 RepID=UPI001FB7701E|nr:tumor susceptibility gene 101 protein [Mugil cephalus]